MKICICICGSFKFWREMLKIEALLKENGIECLMPEPFQYCDREDPSRFTDDLPPREELLPLVRGTTFRHLAKIDKADFVLVANPGGYVGVSTLIEIGYAYGRRKPLYALEEFEDLMPQILTDGIVSAEELVEIIRRRGVLRRCFLKV